MLCLLPMPSEDGSLFENAHTHTHIHTHTHTHAHSKYRKIRPPHTHTHTHTHTHYTLYYTAVLCPRIVVSGAARVARDMEVGRGGCRSLVTNLNFTSISLQRTDKPLKVKGNLDLNLTVAIFEQVRVGMFDAVWLFTVLVDPANVSRVN